MTALVKAVLSLSLSGTLLGLAVFALGRLLRGRVSQRWRYYIWLAVLARLLLPIAWEDGPVGALFRYDPRSEAVWPEPQGEKAGTVSDPMEPRVVIELRNDPVFDMEEFRRKALLPDAAEIACAVWLAVAAGLILRRLWQYRRFSRAVRAGCTPAPPEWRERFGQLAERRGLRRPVGLFVNEAAASPMLLGVWKPWVVLPPHVLAEPGFSLAVGHELTHLRRLDPLYQRLTQLAVCLHWFNPFVYWMAREIDRRCELSCDEALLRELDGDGRRAYGETLLRTAAHGLRPEKGAPLALYDGKALLRERLREIAHAKPLRRRAAALAAAFTVTVCAGGFALGAYLPPGERSTPPDTGQADSNAGMTDGCYQKPYVFVVGLDAAETVERSMLSVGGRPLTVYWTPSCEAASQDAEAIEALRLALEDLYEKKAEPSQTVAVYSARYVGEQPLTELAEQFEQEQSLHEFCAVYRLLDLDAQREMLRRLMREENRTFFATAFYETAERRTLAEGFVREALDRQDALVFRIALPWTEDPAALAQEAVQTAFDEDDREIFAIALSKSAEPARLAEEYAEKAYAQGRAELFAAACAELDGPRLRAWKARARADGNAEASAAISAVEEARSDEAEFGAQGVLFTGTEEP